MDPQRSVTADRIHGHPARFAPEDLVHLRDLLGDTSPRPVPPSRLTIEEDQGARQPATTSIQTREEKQREKYRNRYRNRIVRSALFDFETDVHLRASLI
jgi:hypothetical protein